MEYYDSLNKTSLHEFYMEKLNKLLYNEKVIQVLDDGKFDLYDKNDLKLFKEDPYQNATRRRSMSNTDLVCLTQDFNNQVALTEGCDWDGNRNEDKKLFRSIHFSDFKYKVQEKIIFKKYYKLK
jgi:hypothetical protein